MKHVGYIAILVLIFIAGIIPARGQYVNIQILQQEAGGQPMPKSGVQVYSFYGKMDAERALAKFKAGGSIGKSDGVLDTEKSMGQVMQLRGSYSGYLIIDDGFEFTEAVACQSLVHSTSNGQQEMVYTFHTAKKSKIGGNLKSVDVKGRRTARKARNGSAYACGTRLAYDKEILLPKDYTRTGARWVVSPYLILPDHNNDTVCFLPPVVYDGKEYHKTMERFMGFSRDKFDHDRNDSLGRYVIPFRYMQTRTDDQVHVSGVYENYDEHKNYKLLGHVWWEDYNTVYHEDLVTIWDGKPKRPQRYLDWTAAMIDVPIEATRYARRELLEIQNFADILSLEFEQGKASLNMNDSTTVSQLNMVIGKLNAISTNPESDLQSITIRGYSSPEGSLRRNRELSHLRAEYLAQVIRNRVGGHVPSPRIRFDSNDNIVPWEKVVHVLDSINSPEGREIATDMRAIISRTSNMDNQWALIRNRSWYPYIRDHVLPGLRQVVIEYAATEARIIPSDETYKRYLAHEPGYWDGTKLMPYQFYHLMNHLDAIGDWEGLERISREAYNSSNQQLQQVAWRHTRDIEHPFVDAEGDTTYNLKPSEEFMRPYDLAAFYLSKCLLHRGKADTKMLQQYLDDSNNGLENQKRDNTGNLREWWNDEAIAINQTRMYCLDNDFVKASYCAANHLPETERYHTFRMMLRALNCEWHNPEVMEAVASTSPMNAVTMYIAQDEPQYYALADSILDTDTTLSKDDPRIEYLRAICRFHTECTTCNDEDVRHYASQNVYDPTAQLYGDKSSDWAAPMIRAFKMDSENVEYIKTDGYFNDAYRAMVLYFWKRMQDGVPMENIAKEYDELVTKHN